MDENHLAHMVAAAIFVLLQSNYFININIKQTEEQNIVLLTVLRDLCQQYQNSNGTGNTSSSRRRMEKEIKDSTWKSDHKLIFQLLPRNYTRTQMRTWNCTLLYFVWTSSHLITHSFTADTDSQLFYFAFANNPICPLFLSQFLCSACLAVSTIFFINLCTNSAALHWIAHKCLKYRIDWLNVYYVCDYYGREMRFHWKAEVSLIYIIIINTDCLCRSSSFCRTCKVSKPNVYTILHFPTSKYFSHSCTTKFWTRQTDRHSNCAIDRKK